MDLLPAIDIRGGAAVRLAQGDFAREDRYGDPLELAAAYLRAGARWIHVVDLEAARTGEPVSRALVLELVELAQRAGAAVQVGGGVRREADVTDLLGGGAARVVMGTAAVCDPRLVASLAARYPGRVAVGIDHRGGGAEVAVSGWEAGGGVTVAAALASLAGAPLGAVVVTAIETDGMRGGPDLDGLRRVLEQSEHPVIASGGVRSADDLRTLAALESGGRRLAGAVVGRAIVEGELPVAEGIAACAPSA